MHRHVRIPFSIAAAVPARISFGFRGEVGPAARPRRRGPCNWPDKQIAKGFDPVVIVTDSGKVHSGTIKEDDGKQVRPMTADGTVVVIPKAEIEEQVRGRSSLPENLIKKTSRFELRDLVEFLAGLR